MNGDTHEKLWDKINMLNEKTYRQQTQIEVLKEKNADEKEHKAKTSMWMRTGFGFLGSALIGVIAYAFGLSSTISRLETQVETHKRAINAYSEELSKVQDWTEQNFVTKEFYKK